MFLACRCCVFFYRASTFSLVLCAAVDWFAAAVAAVLVVDCLQLKFPCLGSVLVCVSFLVSCCRASPFLIGANYRVSLIVTTTTMPRETNSRFSTVSARWIMQQRRTVFARCLATESLCDIMCMVEDHAMHITPPRPHQCLIPLVDRLPSLP